MWLKALNLYLYSSLHIAVCSTLMTAYTYLILGHPIVWDYCLFIGSASIGLYAVHRVIGIDKVGRFEDTGRFAIIKAYSNHLQVYVVISLLVSFYFFLQLSFRIWVLLVFPVIISLLYVLPIFTGYRRLRDFPYLKIICISLVWAWLTTYIPISTVMGISGHWIFIFLLKTVFVFSITVPFDIRDLEVDQMTGVKTIATKWGIHRSRSFSAYGLIIYIFGILGFFLLTGKITTTFLLTELIVAALVFALIAGVKKDRGDYYYTLFIDGTMALFFPFFLVFEYLMKIF